MIIPVKIKKRIITCKKELVEDNVDTFTLDLSFDEMWEGFTKRVTFYNDGLESSESNPIEMLIEDTSCVVPWEVLQSSGNLFLTVVGTKAGTDEVIVTQLMSSPIRVNVSGRHEGGEPQRPTPDEVTLLIQLANDTKKIAQSVRDDADAGKFKGDQGPKGDTGEQGPQGDIGPQGPQGKSGRLRWRKICRETITEDVAQYIRDVDENGKPLSDLKALIVRFGLPNWPTSARTTVYLNLRKCETGDEDCWTELEFAPIKVSETTGIPTMNQVNIQTEPWVHGSFAYKQFTFEDDSGERHTINKSEYNDSRLPNGGVFDYTVTNFVDVIQFDTQVEDKLLPAGMTIEIWGADYEG